MKRICGILGLVLLLSACEMKNEPMDQAIAFREALLGAKNCHFETTVTADYGDSIHRFGMDCQGDSSGNLEFEIIYPDSISDLRGKISNEGGKIEFEDKALYFPLMTDDLLTPASAPWIFLKTLRSGYIRCVGIEDASLRLTIDDSYDEDSLILDIWIESEQPHRADILQDGKRILSLDIESFVLS